MQIQISCSFAYWLLLKICFHLHVDVIHFQLGVIPFIGFSSSNMKLKRLCLVLGE